jgi:hypothetical protein
VDVLLGGQEHHRTHDAPRPALAQAPQVAAKIPASSPISTRARASPSSSSTGSPPTRRRTGSIRAGCRR